MTLYPRLRIFARPLSFSTIKCFKRPPTPATNFILHHQMRYKRFESSRSTRSRRSVWGSLKILIKDSPILVPTALILMFISSVILLWTNKYYSDYIIGAFHTFPEPVAKQLRKALFYTNVDFKPGLALKYFKEAIRVAEELGVDRFSDEMMGIKVQIALLFEKCEKYSKAIEVLEALRIDNMKWLELIGLRDGWEAKRNIVLKKTIQITIKLGDLYGNRHVLEQELAEERLNWAVAETLREQQRRDSDGVKEGEGSWFDEDHLGSQFETMAHMHEEKERYYLSGPLFLQALNLSPPGSCHTAILMNNLATSLVQQIPPINYHVDPAVRENLISNASAWIEKAIALANRIEAPERNEECDTCIVVATYNMAELAEIKGDLEISRKKYEEAAQLAKKIGFKAGLKRAKDALKRIEKDAEKKI